MTNISSLPIIIENAAFLSQYNGDIIKLHLIPSILLTMIMMLIGAPGNILVVIIYIKRKKNSTSRIFIIALAVCDLVNCCFSMPVELYLLLNFVKTDDPVLCKISRFQTFLMNDGSSTVLVGIAFDRFFHLVTPFKRQMTVKFAIILVIGAMMFSLLVSWPSLFIYGTQTILLPTVKQNVFLRGKMCLIDDNIRKTKYPTIFSSTIMTCNIVVDILLIGLYSTIACKVLHSAKVVQNLSLEERDAYRGSTRSQRPSLQSGTSGGSWRDRLFSRNSVSLARKNSIQNFQARRARMIKTTFMLFIVTLLFIISFVPYCIIVTIRNLRPELLIETSNVNKAAYNLFLRTYFLSSALNPIIYSFMSEQFRTECKTIFNTIFRKLFRRS